jgi:hypothetical protein
MTSELVQKRARQLRQEKRRGLVATACVVLIVALISYWKFQFEPSLWYDAGIVVAAVWAITSMIVLRKRIWSPPKPTDAFSASSVDFYRSELIETRSHLKATWAWGAPAFLVVVLFGARLASHAWGKSVPLWNVAPFTVLLVAWAGIYVHSTRSKLRELDAELRDLEGAR